MASFEYISHLYVLAKSLSIRDNTITLLPICTALNPKSSLIDAYWFITSLNALALFSGVPADENLLDDIVPCVNEESATNTPSFENSEEYSLTFFSLNSTLSNWPVTLNSTYPLPDFIDFFAGITPVDLSLNQRLYLYYNNYYLHSLCMVYN